MARTLFTTSKGEQLEILTGPEADAHVETVAAECKARRAERVLAAATHEIEKEN